MQEVTTLASSLSAYGLYTIVALLVVAVVYLYKKVNDLQREVKSILQDQLKDQVELNARCTRALEDCTKALEKIETLFVSNLIKPTK